ncbi:MAG TPA: DUF2059 domain-containing protein [Chitinophagaceae bacterium]|nr:DUF2059 domain-containing protein [Chitinophagaceae bacterium]
MKKTRTPLFLMLILLLATAVEAQKTKPGVKQPVKKETAASKRTTKQLHEAEGAEANKIDVAEPALSFDTTAAPADELTFEIKKMLAVSNAVSIGLAAAENMLVLQRKNNTDEKLGIFYDRFLQTFKSSRGRSLFENVFIKIYRENYTLDEIKELEAFYNTPIGKKTLQVTPVILQKSQSQCGQLGEYLGMEVYQQLTNESNN